MKFLKKNFKWIITIIVSIILASGISVYATNTYLSSKVSYTTSKNAEIENVEDALNDLYTKQLETKKFVAFFNSTFSNLTNSERQVDIVEYNSSIATSSNNILTISEPGSYTAYITVGHSPQNSQWTNIGKLYINNTKVAEIMHNYLTAQGTVRYNFTVNDGENKNVKYVVIGDTNLSNTAEFGSLIILKND